ncbi:heterogeneous nuclear ribonucleoprotein K-like [Pollicipes pollicipes]|uniref:heterogeneous nuclear ribonucleoprotein K-like n=1 Tax=Pollicipes pollicipes TaxID=41117 RepID=UPI0018855E02|nr:heterogeneous nuclear ribonucleoprotein K-like [Pollicipes pollicipes]XP_037080470.1 heterogeneous nuclear ribonucleoprotein K-like [Pollicipes pollicipes]XP_037080471.1 heterogeneous nuclear ribonucleoprotein K-like [Pollicipes pollicipes]XP_037080472.1 heterogeneous nuclear ribonucleoprotein K-like [Pollicipes pollicipes]
MKRSLAGEETMSTTKRYRPQDMSLRLLISSRAAGSVIGKGGSNINRLREQNGATISIPDTLGPERVVNIGAERDTTLKIVEDLLPSLDDVPGRDPDSTEGELRLLVHTSQAGSIIGRSGFKIKELREETGTQVRVYTEPCPQSTDRVTQISGPRASVLQCLGRILTLLAENPPKGLVNPYDPVHYDEVFASEYGGFSEGRGRAGPQAALGRAGFPGRGAMAAMAGARAYGVGGVTGARGGYGRGAIGMGVADSGMNMGYGMAGQVNQLPPGGMDFSAPASSTSLTPVPAVSGGDQQTQQFSVPKGAAGAIIGKGGARIRKIRADSGAQINIDDVKDGQVERIVTISGSAEQIQMAHFLLQKCVRENSDGAY